MSWRSIADLLVETGTAELALVGAPMEAGSVTPGRCDLAPAAVRRILRRFSSYDVETATELDLRLLDAGDADVAGLLPVEGFAPILSVVRRCTIDHALTLLLGGNNAVTRPAAHALGEPLDQVGLVTLDAHFDLRETGQGLSNGNPVRALLEDGLPGANICQIGLAPFANTARMHADALARIGHAEAIMVDFDIDVIDRAQCPGAPGARPGGMPVDMFFEAARILAADPRVSLVDLTEFDPSLDLGDITALTAGRWVCEILAGFSARPRS